jgi:hypothetical protein
MDRRMVIERKIRVRMACRDNISIPALIVLDIQSLIFGTVSCKPAGKKTKSTGQVEWSWSHHSVQAANG